MRIDPIIIDGESLAPEVHELILRLVYENERLVYENEQLREEVVALKRYRVFQVGHLAEGR